MPTRPPPARSPSPAPLLHRGTTHIRRTAPPRAMAATAAAAVWPDPARILEWARGLSQQVPSRKHLSHLTFRILRGLPVRLSPCLSGPLLPAARCLPLPRGNPPPTTHGERTDDRLSCRRMVATDILNLDSGTAFLIRLVPPSLCLQPSSRSRWVAGRSSRTARVRRLTSRC